MKYRIEKIISAKMAIRQQKTHVTKNNTATKLRIQFMKSYVGSIAVYGFEIRFAVINNCDRRLKKSAGLRNIAL